MTTLTMVNSRMPINAPSSEWQNSYLDTEFQDLQVQYQHLDGLAL